MSNYKRLIIINFFIQLISFLNFLLGQLWIRFLIFCLYVYHIFVQHLIFFDSLEYPMTLTLGESGSYGVLGIWLTTEITNQLRLHKATNYTPIGSILQMDIRSFDNDCYHF